MNKWLWAIIIAVLIIGAGIAGYAYRGKNNTTGTYSTANNTSTSPTTSGKTADYANKGLTEFPKAVLSDSRVTVLNISHNNLTGAIPAEIHNLSNLEVLDASYNQMTGIPAEIGQLHKLKTLNYSYNQITGLPLELGNLTQLQVLDLRGNNVSQQDLSQIKAKLTNTQILL